LRLITVVGEAAMRRSPRVRPSRIAVTLDVDGEVWHQVPSLHASGPEDNHYEVRTDEDGRSTITFGDGEHGRRLPPGSGRLTATYRQPRRYTAVVLQQGRVILDRDWNEDRTRPAACCGIYAGVVTNRMDPQMRMRVKVRVPAVLGTQELWALPCVPVRASGIPRVGRTVWILFEAGDPSRPVWIGVPR
jgi:hypothetical protein